MKSKLTFEIENLLFGIDYPRGPIAQVQFAKNVAEHMGINCFNRLVRVQFADSSINKSLPGGVPLEETLLFGYDGGIESVWYLYARGQCNACEIATGYYPSKEISIHDEYHHAIMLQKLSDGDIRRVFTYIWDNLETIQPKDSMTNDW